MTFCLRKTLEKVFKATNTPMESHIPSLDELEPKKRGFYEKVLTTLQASEIPFLVGGTYAFEHYTKIARPTKDLDIFVRPSDCARVFAALTATGCQTELAYPHWLGKIFYGEDFVDVIFNSANGNDEVDDVWFEHAIELEVFGIPVKICSAEEIIRSKAFIMERERWDGADIAHLFLTCSEQLDWSHLIDRFDSHWRVLLSHVILFGYIYPAERERIPNWVMQELLRRLYQQMNSEPPEEPICQGTLLSRTQYLVDVKSWGYQDARLQPQGNMSSQEIEEWTAAAQDKQQ